MFLFKSLVLDPRRWRYSLVLTMSLRLGIKNWRSVLFSLFLIILIFILSDTNQFKMVVSNAEFPFSMCQSSSMARNEKWMPSCTRLMLSRETTSVSFLYTCPDCTTHRHSLELLNWKKMGMRVVYIRTKNCFRPGSKYTEQLEQDILSILQV